MISTIDDLRKRHSGNYTPDEYGEVFLLPYEVELFNKEKTFFDSLSDYDFLKNSDKSLTMKGLQLEIKRLDDLENGIGFWKNFNDSALNTYLNKILRPFSWRSYLIKGNETNNEKPYHNDMLRCLYLLAQLHKVSPSFIRQLSKINDVWSTEFRLYYARTSFYETEVYGAFLAELYAHILFHQPKGIRKLIKSLDVVIDRLVEYADHPLINEMLKKTSQDNDKPSLRILKYSQVASTLHFQALNKYLSTKIDGKFSSASADELVLRENKLSGGQVVATSEDLYLVAAYCVRNYLHKPHILDEFTEKACKNVYYALASDANQRLQIISKGTKGGKKDTSLLASIKRISNQNPRSVSGILSSKILDSSNIPEIHSKYLHLRAQFVILSLYQPGREKEFLQLTKDNSIKIDKVLRYIRSNNLEHILLDVETIEISTDIQIFDYGIRSLPERS